MGGHFIGLVKLVISRQLADLPLLIFRRAKWIRVYNLDLIIGERCMGWISMLEEMV